MVQPPLLAVLLAEGVGEQPLGLVHSEEVLLIRRLLIGVGRRDHHGVDAQIIVEEVEDIAYRLGRVGVEEGRVGGNPKTAIFGEPNGSHRVIEDPLSINGGVVPFPQPVHVDDPGEEV